MKKFASTCVLIMTIGLCLGGTSLNFSHDGNKQEKKQEKSLKSKFKELGNDTRDVVELSKDKTAKTWDKTKKGTVEVADTISEGTIRAVGDAVDGTDKMVKKLKKKLK